MSKICIVYNNTKPWVYNSSLACYVRSSGLNTEAQNIIVLTEHHGVQVLRLLANSGCIN